MFEPGTFARGVPLVLAVAAREGARAGRKEGQQRSFSRDAKPSPPAAPVPDLVGSAVVVSVNEGELIRGILLGRDAMEIELLTKGAVRSLPPLAALTPDAVTAQSDAQRAKYARLYQATWQRSYAHGFDVEMQSRFETVEKQEQQRNAPPSSPLWVQILLAILFLPFCL